MKFDQPVIALRDRGSIEVFDLALHVMALFGKSLLITWVIGVAPFALLNFVLLYPMLDVPSEEFPWRFCWNMILLVVMESQAASMVSTAYLGQAVFRMKATIFRSFVVALKASGRALVSHGLIRLLLFFWLYYLLIWGQPDPDGNFAVVEALFLPLIVGTSLLVRMVRPFITELLVLELNPIFSNAKNPITLGQRSKSLHYQNSDLFLRGLISNIYAFLLFLSVFGTIVCIIGGIKTYSNFNLIACLYFPLALWLVSFFVFVSRYTSYIDTRTNQEGWEIELKLRAEANKLEGTQQ